jgi:hypothetical protein
MSVTFTKARENYNILRFCKMKISISITYIAFTMAAPRNSSHLEDHKSARRDIPGCHFSRRQ